MAIKVQPVLQDTPSAELEELRKQFNALLDVLDTMAGDAADLQTLVQANVKKVGLTKTPPPYKKFPVKG